ncbi:cobyrinate a,c-diamide synthase [Clostridium algidicarnis]|uniref:cobyrinate a,c-diamide synthase n=1 Tax=Clostridium algidicarnis TaxID=37659 RepID=UPI001C0BA3A4|nr:cobyrinate a,c-diamide synthase [Clostridium algidicarnis]MBU3203483.1 cobyrinate a,c-diamide synthase [Clostridium algidicarnis]MBU3211637.1 cobyrinate a,c-diamide synthase [Clostridium algidicarnis]MBU3221855.1 cobyrinate a,c-diamide synthase [Clostridium algidicarnis]
MKSIIFSSNKSGGGKTTVTLGIINSLIRKGYKVQPYKVGPDYIDTAFHSYITGNKSRNLDLFLTGEDAVKQIYDENSKEKDLGIIEGVMGLYDGKGIDNIYSTAHVAKTLNLPVVLIISSSGQSLTLCAEINGIKNFDDVIIAGIILNNITESYYQILKLAIEKHCDLKVFGYIPKDENINLDSRHLGLVQSSEIHDLKEKIDYISDLAYKHIDMESLLESFKEVTLSYEPIRDIKYSNINVSIARDKAFSFYYEENIEILKKASNVKFFSPLNDECIPKDTDLLYIGGGYPEIFKEELSKNESMRISINKALKSGTFCYAECGGLMYLCDSIEGSDMVGFFKGDAVMNKRLQNFGYATLKVTEGNELLPKGFTMNCHEFHKSSVNLEEEKIYELKKILYNGNTKVWNCGYYKNNTLGSYAHLHFYNNIDFIDNLLKRVKIKKDI